MTTHSGSITMSDGRLNSLENEVQHINRDVGEIKSELSDIRSINLNVANSLSRLTVIAEQNQKLEPKIDKMADQIKQDLDKMGSRIRTNEKFIWQAGAVVAAGMAALTLAAPVIIKAMGW